MFSRDERQRRQCFHAKSAQESLQLKNSNSLQLKKLRAGDIIN